MEKVNMSIAEVDDAVEIDLIDLFGYLMKRINIIIAVVLVTMVLGFVKSWLFTTPLYTSTAKLYIANSKDSVINLSDLQLGSSLANDYIEIFKTWEVNQQVIENLNLPYSTKKLLNMIDISNPNNTRIINIEVESKDPNEAALIANEFANVASEYITDVMLTDPPTVLSTALRSKEPTNIHRFRSLVIGAMLGLVAVIAVLTVVYLLDDKIKTSADVQKYTNFTPLAVIPLTELIYDEPEDGKRAKD